MWSSALCKSSRSVWRHPQVYSRGGALAATTLRRAFGASAVPSELVDKIGQSAEEARKRVKRLKAEFGDVTVSKATVNTVLGGMRGPPLLLCETSQVDPIDGVSYRGVPLLDLAKRLPKPTIWTSPPEKGNQPPLAESLLWLLLTGEPPTAPEAEKLRQTLVTRMGTGLPLHVASAVNALPASAHPMTQLVTGVTALQTESRFAHKYREGGLKKQDYWSAVLDDGLTLLAVLPRLAGLIYERSCENNTVFGRPVDESVDWAGNISNLLGFGGCPDHADMMRYYVFLHADHEGGNVSSHTAHLVGSALSDPFLAFAAAMAGLAGPLHGLANQQSLGFIQAMQRHFQENGMQASEENVSKYIKEEILGKGQVVPGFGHAVLRREDPRFTAQKVFAEQRGLHDNLVELVRTCVNVVPPILRATGKVANPYPNVDFHSGVILHHYGITDTSFYTVLFGLSRALGVVSQLVWDRILMLPIERPKSVSLATLENAVVGTQGTQTAKK